MTTLTRWSPFREIDAVFDQLNRGLGLTRLSRDSGRETMRVADWSPIVDIVETDGDYEIKVELPEVRKEDVTVSVDDGVLLIQGERKMEREENGRKYHRVERTHGSFARSFTLPDNVDATTVRATHKNGMLYVHLGKAEEAKPRSIEIKVA